MADSDEKSEVSPTPVDKIVESEEDDNADNDAILKELEELFQDRFTDKDEKYVAALTQEVAMPPLVHPWYNKPQRNFDYNRRPHHHHHHHHDGGGSGDHSRRHQWQPRRGHGHHHSRDNHHHHRSDDNHHRYRPFSNSRDNRHQPY